MCVCVCVCVCVYILCALLEEKQNIYECVTVNSNVYSSINVFMLWTLTLSLLFIIILYFAFFGQFKTKDNNLCCCLLI